MWDSNSISSSSVFATTVRMAHSDLQNNRKGSVSLLLQGEG